MLDRNREERVVVVRPRSRSGWVVAGALVICALLAFTGTLGDLLPSIPNPFSSRTIDRTQPALLEAMEDLSDYKAAAGNFQVLVDSEKDARFLPSFIRGERTVYSAAGTVEASVNFSDLDAQSIVVSEDRRAVTIALPAPTLSEPHLDLDQSRVVSRDRGLLDRLGSVFADTPTGERELQLAAAEKMKAAAGASDLSTRAEENTRKMLESLLGNLGFTSVTVTFVPSPA
ncbi:MAG TPA: DUF4230 domain-containing protein [Acidimicrobiales bacterium]|nr:DUF4230 domain-containing protein [Acidimicrobiales bacterium]